MGIAIRTLAGLFALVLDACDPPCAAIGNFRHVGTTACGDCVAHQCGTEFVASLNASACTAENECFNACLDADGGPPHGGAVCGCEAACLTTPTCRESAENLWSCVSSHCVTDCF